MKKLLRPRTAGEKGIALVYMAVLLTTLLLFSGVALDGGRGYVVKAQLTKAVDGAALGAARNLNSGDPRGEAERIFKANFPAGYFGTTSSTDPTTDPGFFALATDAATGINTVTVTANAVLPTTFMRLGNYFNMNVTATGEATRRMVDLSLILDVSSSIGSKWPIVAAAVDSFIGSFDAVHDRLALLTFSNGASVLDAMPATRGFAKSTLISHVPASLPGGSTDMVEGLYRGWDELRSVPSGTQSGLRIIVLFTDGASNGVPGNWDGTGASKSLRTYDFPKNLPDPDGQTWNDPVLGGFYPTTPSTSTASPSLSVHLADWRDKNTTIPGYTVMVPQTLHSYHRSAGIPTWFPLQTNTINVNGVPQDTRRGLYADPVTGQYKASVWNVNNAARNVLEIIANQARNDAGDYRIRIYTIGMGDLVQYLLGTMPEKPEDILMRISNDPRSPDHNPAQLDGRYFFAQTAEEVGPAFQGIQNQILRLSR
jgi:Flp pilus assembly protein TadG